MAEGFSAAGKGFSGVPTVVSVGWKGVSGAWRHAERRTDPLEAGSGDVQGEAFLIFTWNPGNSPRGILEIVRQAQILAYGNSG